MTDQEVREVIMKDVSMKFEEIIHLLSILLELI